LRRSVFTALCCLVLAGPLAGCAYNADLGRDQLLIVNDSGLAAQGEKAWAQTLRTGNISSDARKNARVRAVGQRVGQRVESSEVHRPRDHREGPPGEFPREVPAGERSHCSRPPPPFAA